MPAAGLQLRGRHRLGDVGQRGVPLAQPGADLLGGVRPALPLAAVLASVAWSPAIVVAGALGAGLVFSALTNTCGMARVLAALPLRALSEGTFYVWLELPPGLTAEGLLTEHRVAVAPGDGFGAQGRGWARLSLAVDDDTLDLGLERLRAALG